MVAKKAEYKRKKPSQSVYTFRLVFQPKQEPNEGCLGVWEVSGGHEKYQIALEHTDRGNKRWHCTCPDAIYRSEPLGRVCKHIVALSAWLAVTDSRVSIQSSIPDADSAREPSEHNA